MNIVKGFWQDMTHRRGIFSMGITKKIVIIVIISVCLSIGLTTIINYLSLTQSFTDNTGEKISVIAEKTGRLIEGEIDNELKLLRIIALSPYVQGEIIPANRQYESLSPAERKEKETLLDNEWKNRTASIEPLIQKIESSDISIFLRAIKAIDPKDVEIMVTDRYGFVVAMTNRTTDYWQRDEDWWQKAEKGSVYISPPVYDGSTQVWALNTAMPIYDLNNNQQIIGIVRGTINVEALMTSIFNIQFGESGKGYFISTDGYAYSGYGGSLIIRRAPEKQLTAIKENAGHWSSQFPDFYGNMSVAGIQEITNESNRVGWILVLMKKNELQMTIISAMQKNLIIAIVLILALGLAGSLMSNNILKVLRILRKEVHQIAEGEYSYSLSKPLTSSNDPDVQGLADSFTRMSLAVQSREKAIQSSEKKYRRLIETMNEGLVMVDKLGRIEFTNPRFAEMSGYTKDELTGQSILMLFSSEEQENVALRWTSRMIGIQTSYETELRRKPGEILPVLISPQRITDEKDEFLGSLAVITDISIGKKVELTQQKKIKELASLRQVDISILASTKLNNVLQTILDQIKNQMGADAASIHIFQPHSTKTRASSALLGEKIYQCGRKEINFQRLHSHLQEQSGQVFHDGISAQVIWKELEKLDIKLLYIAPILVSNELKGIMEVAYFKPVEIDVDWLSFFDALSTQTAVGIEKIELFEKLQTRNKDLQEAYLSAIKGWAKALELRDEETKGHSDRVVEMAVKIAVEFGYKGEDLENFRNGAFLHDIGKMGVPDSILLKPGPLNDEEWILMKKHPVFAYQLLKEIPFLKNAYEIPYYHHERWNGAGYPHGLEGENIPLSARIFSVVDVWDALSNDRPYRKAWSPEAVKKYIEENKRIQFDPVIVDTFFRLFPIDRTS